MSLNEPVPKLRWNSIAFVDCETTGLSSDDRLITLAAILLDVPQVSAGKLKLSMLYRIYNPERLCHPTAAQIHGFTDEVLSRQPRFVEEASEVSEFFSRADLVVCHNAKFDLAFVNRELARSSMPLLNCETFCTMQSFRFKYGPPASLDHSIAKFGMAREGKGHGALEDAWLTMNLFFALHGTSDVFPFSMLPPESQRLQNFR